MSDRCCQRGGARRRDLQLTVLDVVMCWACYARVLRVQSRCGTRDRVGDRASSGPEDNPELYYTADDFIVGNYINVLGRPVLLRSCDPYTRSFYADVLGIEQPAPIPPPEVERAEVVVRARRQWWGRRMHLCTL